MSHLGIKILYSIANDRPDTWCERVFAPWPDMEEKMREEGIPLYALESGDPIKDFDFIGFTLQYEMCYTNVLNMLDLAGLPVRSADRKSLSPIVMGGGPCVCNPEPMADFFDLFSLGEGEEVNSEIMDLYKEHKKRGSSKEEFLMIDRIALLLLIIGGINWGLVGIFQFDLVAFLFGGAAAILSRIIYVLVAISAIWCISLFFKDNRLVTEQ